MSPSTPPRYSRWTVATLDDVVALLRTVKNPGPILADRLGLRRTEYLLRFRDGSAVSVRPGVGDRFAVYETFLRDSYGRALRAVREGATVVDVGANIGCFTLKAASKAGPRGLVIAVEPELTNYKLLEHNVRMNRLRNVRMLRCVVAGFGGVRRFCRGSSALFGSIYEKVNSRIVGSESELVDAVTLQNLCSDQNVEQVDLLKLDCEGAEYEILFGLPDAWIERIAWIVAELHTVSGRRPEEVVGYLVERGFRHDFDGLHHFHRD